MGLKHNDCLYFCSIDAAKGICRITKQLLYLDGDTCDHLVLAPKCNNCEHFHNGDENNLGICRGLAKDDWVYGSLSAATCTAYTYRAKK
jgi:4-hydroxyphenylacetate decarboxylase small subunit